MSCLKLFDERYVRFSTYKIIPFCRFWKYTRRPTSRGDLHKEGATICMVTHDPRFAKHAQREVHLFDGKVVAEEALKKLMADVHA